MRYNRNSRASSLQTRTILGADYRYGFNGKEKDNSFGGQTSYDYGFRIYNPAIAKFLSVDPLTSSYPWYTPYQFAGNKPIWALDLDGLEEYFYVLRFVEETDGEPYLTEESNLTVLPDFLEPDKYRLKDVDGTLFEFNFSSEEELFEFVNGKSVGELRKLSQEEGASKIRNALLFISFVSLNEEISDIENSDFGFDDESSEEAEIPNIGISKSRHPEAAKHAQEAMDKGYPNVGIVDRKGRDMRRKAAMKGVKSVEGKDRDEFPPAVLKAEGKGVSVKAINRRDNRGAGGSIGRQLTDISDGTKVRIIITK